MCIDWLIKVPDALVKTDTLDDHSRNIRVMTISINSVTFRLFSEKFKHYMIIQFFIAVRDRRKKDHDVLGVWYWKPECQIHSLGRGKPLRIHQVSEVDHVLDLGWRAQKETSRSIF
jgi:hypothetical protein